MHVDASHPGGCLNCPEAKTMMSGVVRHCQAAYQGRCRRLMMRTIEGTVVGVESSVVVGSGGSVPVLASTLSAFACGIGLTKPGLVILRALFRHLVLRHKAKS